MRGNRGVASIKNSTRTPRKYGFACSNCRRRKARCNGALPACQKCIVNHETCSYDKGPSVAYAVSLQNQLQAYKDRLEELRLVKDKERDVLLDEPIDTSGSSGRGYLAIRSPPASGGFEDIEVASISNTDDDQRTASDGEDGRAYFYGKTSPYHIDLKEHDGDNFMVAVHESDIDEQSPGMVSISTLSCRNHDTAALLAEIPSTLLDDLLETYWCYPHHLHSVLCKRLFLRDLYSHGPCVTPFLLCAVLAQAARYSTRRDAIEVGHHFARKAQQFMLEDIDSGSSIPTLQGLLVFSARECACGRVSQGWLYSGMAFRMMRDLGIDVSPTKLRQHLQLGAEKTGKSFTEEDLALRRQVFWSCYTWDKTMSVCLGRGSTVPCTVELPTRDMIPFGREADDETWQPTTQISSAAGLLEQRALGSTRFTAYCELCVIIESVLDELYPRPHSGRHNKCLGYLDSALKKLRSWAERLSPELFIKEAAGRTLVCPPLHILLLNLMYHAVTILLCRPYRTVQPTAKEQCIKASEMIDALFILHVKRFGFRFITYLQTYTMFVACTINVLDFTENGSPTGSNDAAKEASRLAQEAQSRLYFGLEVLRQANSTPSAARCAAVISQLIQKQQKASRKDGVEDQSKRDVVETSIRLPIVNSEVMTDAQHQFSKEPPVADIPILAQPPLSSSAGGSQPELITAPSMTPLPIEEAQNVEPNSMHTLLIEQPLQWLPEDVADDGSWMLMTDIDFGL